MIDKNTVKVLKFIADSQPCSFDDIERKFGADFRYSMQMRFIDIVGKLPDGKVLLSLTPEGKSAIVGVRASIQCRASRQYCAYHCLFGFVQTSKR